MTPVRGRRSWAALLLVGAGLTIGMLLVETILRARYTEDEFRARFGGAGEASPSHLIAHPFLPFAGRPGAEYRRYMGETGEFINVTQNTYGFRAREFPQTKGANDYVVVCLGESTTWGYVDESNATTWPALLEQRLAVKYPEKNVKVFNLGMEGGSSAYSVVVLGLIGVHLQPDLVIAYHGFNDYGPATAQSFRTDYAHHYVDVDPDAAWRGFRRNLPGWMLSSYAVTLAASQADRLVRVNSLPAAGQRELGDQAETPAKAARRFLPNLQTIDSLARGSGAQTLFSTFQFYDADNDQARFVNGGLRDYFAEQGLPFVDQDALLPDGDRTINIDQCHLTRKGRELLAGNFFDYIIAHGLVDKANAVQHDE